MIEPITPILLAAVVLTAAGRRSKPAASRIRQIVAGPPRSRLEFDLAGSVAGRTVRAEIAASATRRRRNFGLLFLDCRQPEFTLRIIFSAPH
jgi:hypothetical protein